MKRAPETVRAVAEFCPVGPTCSPVWLMAGISTLSATAPRSPNGSPTSKPRCSEVRTEIRNWALLCAKKHRQSC